MEDRRPAANCDPYKVTARMIQTTGECMDNNVITDDCEKIIISRSNVIAVSLPDNNVITDDCEKIIISRSERKTLFLSHHCEPPRLQETVSLASPTARQT